VKPIIRGEYIDTTLLLQALGNNNGDNDLNIDISAVYNNIHSILHFVNKNDPLGGYPANPANDPQYENWEYGVQKWNRETFGLLLDSEPGEDVEDEEED